MSGVFVLCDAMHVASCSCLDSQFRLGSFLLHTFLQESPWFESVALCPGARVSDPSHLIFPCPAPPHK